MKSPAEEILVAETENHNLIYNEVIDKYVGFMNINTLNIQCEVMASNRIMNNNVIELRVKENKEEFKRTGKLLDFGTAILVVVREHKDDKFYVADGQHRISTLYRLKKEEITDKLWIAVTVKMVDNEKEAREYLRLFQKQYPPDIRMFSENMVERNRKTDIINMFRDMYPNAFTIYDKRELTKINDSSLDNYRMEVERPNLSDGLLCNLYRDIDVFRNGRTITTELIKDMNSTIAELLEAKDEKIKKVDNCAFGLIRDKDIKIIHKINEKFTIATIG